MSLNEKCCCLFQTVFVYVLRAVNLMLGLKQKKKMELIFTSFAALA
jgi:hypothetical protein